MDIQYHRGVLNAIPSKINSKTNLDTMIWHFHKKLFPKLKGSLITYICSKEISENNWHHVHIIFRVPISNLELFNNFREMGKKIDGVYELKIEKYSQLYNLPGFVNYIFKDSSPNDIPNIKSPKSFLHDPILKFTKEILSYEFDLDPHVREIVIILSDECIRNNYMGYFDSDNIREPFLQQLTDELTIDPTLDLNELFDKHLRIIYTRIWNLN